MKKFEAYMNRAEGVNLCRSPTVPPYTTRLECIGEEHSTICLLKAIYVVPYVGYFVRVHPSQPPPRPVLSRG